MSDDLDITLKADEAYEENPDVHGGVEEHGSIAARNHMEVPSTKAQLSRRPEGEGGQHEEVSHHHVLQVDHQTRVTGHSEEDPGSHAIQAHPHNKDHEIERRQDLVGEDAAVVRLVGGVEGLHPWKHTNKHRLNIMITDMFVAFCLYK